MRDVPSATAAWIATWRGLGSRLPRSAQLASDPFGLRFGGPLGAWLGRLPAMATFPAWPMVIYIQVRTRLIDDVLRGFLTAGGRQVLILGAGYDCRAARFQDELTGALVLEVDHPATQARKREVLERTGIRLPARVSFVEWDFARRPMSELPGALFEVGLDKAAPVLTLWEGVTNYLEAAQIDASVGALRGLSAPGSQLVLSYLDRACIDRPRMERRLVARVAAMKGEPFRFGWFPAQLPGWFSDRGFDLLWDRDGADIAKDLLPLRWARLCSSRGHRFALLRRQGDPDRSPGP
jgi:methyltransferase (TIGR00027 family)